MAPIAMISMRHLPTHLLPRTSGQYLFLRARELEGTLDRGPELGAWGITATRIQFGWGQPFESELEHKGYHRRWPPSLPPEVDEAARPNRIAAYRRVRTAQECAEFIRRLRPVLGAFTITPAWLGEEAVGTGRIQYDPALPLIGSHAFNFVGANVEAGYLEFDNSFWGRQWGDNGYGRLPFDYFDSHLIEAYVWAGLGHSLADQSGELLGTPLSLPRTPHAMVVYGTADDSIRYGWAMFFEADEAIHVDDLYVRPEYRRRGWGQRLWGKLLEMSDLCRKPLHLWIPFADCEPGHLDFLHRFFGARGYALTASSVRWAGYEVKPGPMPSSIPAAKIPERPALSLGTVLKSAATLGIAVNVAGLMDGNPGEPAAIERAADRLSAHTHQLLHALETLASLRIDWNSYGAPIPANVAIRNARALLIQAGVADVNAERVEPSAMGGVGVTFESGDREVVVEFYNNGSAHALFSEDSTGEMHTRPVSTDMAGYNDLIDEVRRYLHAC